MSRGTEPARRILLGTAVAVAVLLGPASAQALAGPSWSIDLHHNETHFPPGGTAEYWVDVVNVGDSSTTGTTTVTINLPSGMTRNNVRTETDQSLPDDQQITWSCPGSAGASTVVCTTGLPIPRRTMSRSIIVTVDIAPGASGARFATGRVQGGGAPAQVTTQEFTLIDPQPAGFGIVEGSWKADFLAADGLTPVRQSGAHPDQAIFSFDFNSITPEPGDPTQKAPAETIRNLRVDLPPGFVGNPTAVGECTPAELTAAACPVDSQVGRADVITYPLEATNSFRISTGVFNMTHPLGTIADLAFVVAGNPVHIKASLDPSNNYTVKTTVSDINESIPPFSNKVTIWGVPADPSHDAERCVNSVGQIAGAGPDCPAGLPPKPFLTVPFECGVDNQMKLSRYDSWQNSGVFGADLLYSLPGQFSGCATPQAEFDPDVSIVPTNSRADSPTGLNVTASIPYNDDPSEVSSPPVKRLQVELPEGMSLNPSFADGLVGCTEAQIGISHAGVPDDQPVTCPDQARIGAVELSTPVLPLPLEGSIYLAKQEANPLNELFAIYTVVRDTEDRGVLLKLPGKLELDPETGQITTTFDELPQLPFDSLSVQFRSGDRAPLVNPPTCGIHDIAGTLNTWSEPDVDVAIGSTFVVDSAPAGGPCIAGDAGQPADPADRADLPFTPVMSAGTTSAAAGQHSPFVLKLTRQDGEQEIARIEADLPPGLTGKLAGIAQCSDATLSAIPEAPGTGQAEIDSPSCPANSLVGHTNAGSGAGPQPFYIHGKVYLAGPFDPDGPGPRGTAPLSIAAVTPAVTGGLDLGNVVIRTALYVDPDDAQLHAVSGQIPTILHGVPIHLRDIRVVMDRPGFTLNPTNCTEMLATGQISGAGGTLVGDGDDTTVAVQDRFKVSGCGALDFGPSMSAKILNGREGTGRSQHPNLQFNLTGRSGDANLSRVEVILPQAFQIDQASLGNLCSETQLAASDCAGRQRIGTAQATTPILDTPLSGPVYAVSGSGGLPKLAVILYGPPSMPIKLVVRGTTETVGARLKNTFPLVPDAPVSDFQLTLDGGPAGYLVNNQNLCTKAKTKIVKVKGKKGKKAKKRKVKKIVKAGAQYSDIQYYGQNGDSLRQTVPVGVECQKLKKKKGKKKGKKGKKK